MQKKNRKVEKKSNFEKKTKKLKGERLGKNAKKKKKECNVDYNCNPQYIVCGWIFNLFLNLNPFLYVFYK